MSKLSKTLPTVTIYTDGACSVNPGPGGWASIIIEKNFETTISGHAKDTTNNRMELTAVIEAINFLALHPYEINIYSDSAYVINGLSKGWAKTWKENGWLKSNGQPALNADLWDELLRITAPHIIHCHLVKGHSTNEYNNKCDAIAVKERDYAKNN